MKLVERSVARPVATIAFTLMLVALGAASIARLPVREFPDVDPPIVSVSVVHPGASAAVVERDVTQEIEEGLGGIRDVEQIRSTSRDGFAQIDVEFARGRDLDAAAADVRDRVSATRNELPEEVEEPEISKASADAQAMMWITIRSERRDRMALTDLAVRDLVDPLSIVPGVARVLIGGERRYALRVWLDRDRLAARGVTVGDVVRRLRAENVELPGGRLETGERDLSVRLETKLSDPEAFRALVVRDEGGRQVRLADVARVEIGPESDRSAIFRSGEPAIGLGIVRQSGANALAVAHGVRRELARLEARLPGDLSFDISYDQSIFIEGSIREVLRTLALTAGIVLAVIFLFLGSLRATLVPAITIPSSIAASFLVLLALGFSINTLTLLALVLAIGLVVDDAIVVLESAVRRREQGEPPLAAAVRGGGEVALAVVATTAVLVAVLLPIGAATGTVGRLFREFSLTLAAAIVFSSLLALTIGAWLSSQVAEPAKDPGERRGPLRWTARGLDALERGYGRLADRLAGRGAAFLALALVVGIGAGAFGLFRSLPGELAPTEDRGTFIVPVEAPQGVDLDHTIDFVRRLGAILGRHRGGEGGSQSGDHRDIQGGAPDPVVEETIEIVGLARAGPPKVNEALVIVKLLDWSKRETSQQALVESLLPEIVSLPGAKAVPVNPVGLIPDSFGKPIQYAIGADDHEQAFAWAQTVLAAARERGLMRQPEIEFDRSSPQVVLEVDRGRAASLGLSAAEIGSALRVFFSGDDVTELYWQGETYEVRVRGEPGDRDRVDDLETLPVRTRSGALVPLASVVRARTQGAAASYRRVDRQPSVLITGIPGEGRSLGGVLAELDEIVASELPAAARVRTLGLSREFRDSSSSFGLVFGLGLLIVFLVLSALFGSFVQPLAILAAVPVSLVGGLAVLALFGQSLNVYSQVGLLLVVGLLAKNAVLLVDRANRLRRAGEELESAIRSAARDRFRPILMTSISTSFGAVPLVLASGPGAEARSVLGLVVLAGVLGATLITVLLVPGLYRLVAGLESAPGERRAELRAQLEESA